MHFEYSLLECPQCIRTGEARANEKLHPTIPFPSLFRIGAEKQEFASWYGYVMLLAQYLEFQVLECVLNIRCWRAYNEKDASKVDLEDIPTFNQALRELEIVFDQTHESTRAFIRALHKARTARNRLSHDFFKDPVERKYFFSAGGCAKKLQEIKSYERIFYPVICEVSFLARAYAADWGFTNEVVDRLIAQQEAEEQMLDESEGIDESSDLDKKEETDG